MSNVVYDMKADTALTAAGNRLHQALIKHSGLEDWEAFGFSVQMLTAAVDYVPFGDGPDHLSDEETRVAIPRVEDMLALVEALNAKLARPAAPAPVQKRIVRRFV